METRHQSTELHRLGQNDHQPSPDSTIGEQETVIGIEQASLPPADRGKQAWLVLAGCSLIQIPVWGYSLAFGVFQEYYGSHPNEIDGDISNIAVIGTTMTGIMYLISPFTFTILSRWPRLRRWFGPLGLILSAAGFLMSSFATKVWQLIATQGVVCALGCGLMFTPTTLYLDEWFIKRKGLAYGVMWAGKSAAGVGIPFAIEALLQRFGPVTTLRAWGVATVLLSAPLIYFLKPRIPLSQSTAVRRISLDFIFLPSFWMLQIGNILQSLGYFLPYTYLTTYAVQQLHVSTTIATALLVLINVTSIPGGIVMGSLGDHLRVTTVILISTIGSALAVFLFWGFSSHTALLAVFSITYGFFAGGFSSTWSGVLSELKAQSPALDTGFIFGLLAGGRG
ncbi:Fujikurins efflux protein [Colletotrichum siamense]|uniref:Fujikurins efflux protein n=1 Tax=Colletotrichum siamense TaxID=690259 RepID=UPI0018724E39|nr:Fujikurins efflux protein [Colletotrichum siamense]KAF5509990.1 Fujikurins efflux protein [Colletotrichum siamense]